MTLDTAAGLAPFDNGRVINRAFATVRRYWPVLFVASAVFVGGTQSALFALRQYLEPLEGPFTRLLSTLMVSLLDGVLYSLFTAWVALLAVEPPDDGSLGGALSLLQQVSIRAPQTLLAALASSVCIMFGSFLIVPGLMLAAAWSVVVPALAVERLGVRAAFGRSLALTRGYRWSIVGLMVLMAIATSGANFITAMLAGQGLSLVEAQRLPLVGLVLSPIIFTTSQIVASAGLASIYVELADAKGGVLRTEIARVFN